MSTSKHLYRWWDYFVFEPPTHTLHNPTWETFGSIFPGQDVGLFVPQGPAATYAAHGFIRVFQHRAAAPTAYSSLLKWNLVRLAHAPPTLMAIGRVGEASGAIGAAMLARPSMRDALSHLINTAHVTGMLQYVWDTAVNDRSGKWRLSPIRHATYSERINSYKRGNPDPAVLLVPEGEKGLIIHDAV